MPIDWSERVLAFDTSFMVFHQYYSAIKKLPVCSFSDVTTEIDTALEKDRRLQAFGSKLYDTIVSKARLYNVEMSNVCFLMDCPRDQIWRKELLPSYKECRIKSSGFDPNAFNHTRDVILPTFVEQGANIISCDTAEADDLAAGLARCAIRSSAKEAIIITGDSDFAQLVTGPVKVHDISKACLLEKQGLFDPKVALLRKILSGDKSDNIPSIKPRLGPKTAIALSNDPEALAALLSVLTVSEAFERNRTLIDLNAAPSELQYRVDEVFNALS
jgi:5'-3' exonuclease